MGPYYVVLIGFLVIFGILVLAIRNARRKKKDLLQPVPSGYKQLLAAHVGFYRTLDDTGKALFEQKIESFLGEIRIHGVKTEIEDLDRILVAASGVIPVFGFPEWKYYNLTDVLLYGEAFDSDHFASEGNRQDVIGMVGSGAMERVMILSKPALRQGYDHIVGKENTGIHEFVHLLDKADGAVDGVPEALLDKHNWAPWVHLLAENIHNIQAGYSDINPYAAKNKAEFFAVTAEYFFKRSDLFKVHHPELYQLMHEIFRQEPGVDPLLRSMEHHTI